MNFPLIRPLTPSRGTQPIPPFMPFLSFFQMLHAFTQIKVCWISDLLSTLMVASRSW
jgi:hypothetical protein